MPVKIPNNLPAREILTNENIFVMDEDRATHQDIRPLRIAIINLMPTKIVTETQLIRLLSNTPLQVELTLARPAMHHSRHTPDRHLDAFYKTFSQIRNERFDGLIITGAPIAHLPFEEVDYWEEMKDIIEWQVKHVFTTMYLCWGAEAALYHLYGIPKHALAEKRYGVFAHQVNQKTSKLLRGFDDMFFVPRSHQYEIRREDIEKNDELKILAYSEDAGIYLVSTCDERQIFMMGHPEYDPLTLKQQYQQDLKKGSPVSIPKNYFPDDDPTRPPIISWRAHANLLYFNWLNYYVYQETPFNLDELESANSFVNIKWRLG